MKQGTNKTAQVIPSLTAVFELFGFNFSLHNSNRGWAPFREPPGL